MADHLWLYRFSRGKLAWRLGVVFLATVAALAVSAVAFADEGHTDHGGGIVGLSAGPLLWGALSLGGVFLFLIASRFLLVRRMARQPIGGEAAIGYLTALRRFSLNARLFLTYSLLAELGSGIWTVMFNLYLLRVGYDITFIGAFWLVNMVTHGASALPAGVIADRFGRRRAFFIATGVALAAQGSLLFTQSPLAILILGGVAGFGEAFHGVTGAPFMMENSEPAERPHLFGLNSSFLQFSRFGGNLVGGMLPLAWASLLGVPAVEPGAARWALATGLPLTILALVPLAFMREKPVEMVESLKDLVTLRNVVHFGIVARLTLLGIMTGAAFGLTIRFFNIFFQEAHGASDSQVGAWLAMGSLAGASAVLVAPVLAQRWGKVRSIVGTQILSLPFLVLMALVPSLSLAGVLFLMRGTLYSMAMPLRNQLAMEFVEAKERATTAGFTHMAFDLGGGVGALIAGGLIAGGGFSLAFTAAAGLIFVPGVLYYVFFARMESQAREAEAAAVIAQPYGARR